MSGLFHFKTFIDETVQFTIGTANTNTLLLRWRLHSGAGSAVSSFWVAPERVGDPELADLDPATNSRWIPTPFAFPSEPGGGLSSDGLPFADVSGNTLLWQIVVTGTIELSGDVDTQGAHL